MVPRLLRLHPSTYQQLTRLSKEADRDGAYRVANTPAFLVAAGPAVDLPPQMRRSQLIRGIVLNSERANNPYRGGDCPLPVVLDHAGLPRGSCPASVMPESRWAAPLAIVLVFLLALGCHCLLNGGVK